MDVLLVPQHWFNKISSIIPTFHLTANIVKISKILV